MKVEFPLYKDGKRVWTNEIVTKEVDDFDYCSTTEDLNNFIDNLLVNEDIKTKIKLFELIEQIKYNINIAIETNKPISYINEIYECWKKE